MNGGKWRLSLSERHLYHCHATVTDSYTLCPISGHVSHTLFHFHYHIKTYPWKVTDGQRWTYTDTGAVERQTREGD